jgi:hypothetical protein
MIRYLLKKEKKGNDWLTKLNNKVNAESYKNLNFFSPISAEMYFFIILEIA